MCWLGDLSLQLTQSLDPSTPLKMKEPPLRLQLLRRRIASEVVEEEGARRGLRARPVTVVLKLLAVVAPPGYPTPLQGGGGIRGKVGSIIKSTSQSLMVRPAIPKVWARPSTDGLEASPTTGITTKMNILWLKLLEP